jgi:H+-transporting ATPase
MKANLAVKNTSEYKAIPAEETLRLLETSTDGLSDAEVQRRLQIFGLNEVVETKKNPVVEFFLRYWDPMPWLLELAIVLSIFLKHYLEAGIIFALLTINTVIGQIQSRGSQRALEALKKRLAVKARMLRDGKWITMEARQIDRKSTRLNSSHTT